MKKRITIYSIMQYIKIASYIRLHAGMMPYDFLCIFRVSAKEEPTISFSKNFRTSNFNEIFQLLILLYSTLCIPPSVEYIEYTEMATEFLLFVLIATLGGIFLCDANNLIDIFVAQTIFQFMFLSMRQALPFWFMVSLHYMLHLGGDRASILGCVHQFLLCSEKTIIRIVLLHFS